MLLVPKTILVISQLKHFSSELTTHKLLKYKVNPLFFFIHETFFYQLTEDVRTFFLRDLIGGTAMTADSSKHYKEA